MSLEMIGKITPGFMRRGSAVLSFELQEFR